MTDGETDAGEAALAALWAMDQPPVRDPLFEMTTLERVSRRRWLTEAVEIAALGVPVLAILWAAWPTLAGAAPQMVRLLAAYGPLAVCIGAVVLVTWSTREIFALDP